METVSQWIYNNLKSIYNLNLEFEKVKDYFCWLCGGETEGIGSKKKDAIKKTFTNHDYSNSHESNSICSACSFLLSQDFIYYNPNKKQDSKMKFRNTSWIITDTTSYPTLNKEKDIIRISNIPNPEIIREFLLSNDKKKFVVLYSSSGQKHLFFRANQVNNNISIYEIVYEETTIYINQLDLSFMLEYIETLLAFGISKSAILSGNIFTDKIDMKFLKSILNYISLHKENKVFEFCVKISVNKEEKTEWELYKKIKDYMVSIQTIADMQSQVKSFTQSTNQEILKDSHRKHEKTTGVQSKDLSKKHQEVQQQLFNL